LVRDAQARASEVAVQRTILVVAADDVAVAQLTGALDTAASTYQVASATSLAAAKEWLATHQADVIVAMATLGDGRSVELLSDEVPQPMVLITRSAAEECAARQASSQDLDFLAYAADQSHLILLPHRVRATLQRAARPGERCRSRAPATSADVLQTLADHIPVLLGYWTRDQICGYANHAYEQWFGIPLGRIIGMSMRELLGPLYAQNVPHIEAALRGERRDFERLIRNPASGSERHALISYIPFVHKNQIDGFFVVVSDVSEQKRLEARLRESQQRWETLFSILPVGVSTLDAHGNVTTANPELGRILGLAPEAILRGEYQQLCFIRQDGSHMPPEEFATSLARRTHQPASTDLGLLRGDGNTCWISTTAAPIPDQPGSFVIATSDVTLRRQAERALAENEARLRALLDAAVDGIVTIDEQQKIRTANRAVSKMFGYPLEQLLGVEVGILMPNQTHHEHRGYISHYETTGEAKVIGKGREVIGRHCDGSELPLFLSVAVLPPEANVGKYIATLHDLRARKAVEAEKRVLEDHLRESEKLHAVGRLAGGVAHDFNNILTVVELCGTKILGSETPGSLVHREIEQILGAGRRGADLVRQLLTFSRPDLVSRSTVDLSAVVRRLEPMLRRLLPANIQFTVDTTESEPVEADLAQMDQVIMNLVLNARDAMRNGGTLTVTVRSLTLSAAEASARPPLRAGTCVELLVRDSGIGMSKSVSERAFEPFFTTKAPGLGTGLGLATVYAIVQEADGSIELSTAPRQGTSIRIWLPRASAALDSVRPAPLTPALPVRNTTVLLVEDQPEILDLVAQILAEQGYHVLSAETGERAVEIAAGCREPIDLLFTDVMMPGLSGPQVFAQVATLHPRIKVLFASGYSDEVVELNTAQPVSFEFLAKPYSVADLLATVARILGCGST
jgi:PAS domain S-box-containing protein